MWQECGKKQVKSRKPGIPKPLNTYKPLNTKILKPSKPQIPCKASVLRASSGVAEREMRRLEAALRA